MRTIGSSHRCLILARLPDVDRTEPTWTQGADGVVGPPGGRRDGLVFGAEVSEPSDVRADSDLLVLPAREIAHRPLIEACAASGLPLAMCTHGATLKDITRAVGWFRLAFRVLEHAAPRGIQLEGGGRLVVVHGEGNLRAMARVSSQTFAPAGYEGEHGALAVASGAVLAIAPASAVFQDWAKEIRSAERVLGDGAMPANSGVAARRLIIARSDIAAGTMIGPDHLAYSEPTSSPAGFATHEAENVVGRAASRDIQRGSVLSDDVLEGAVPQTPDWFTPGPPKAKPLRKGN